MACSVFAIRYRTVSCDAVIQNEAPAPTKMDADPHAGDKPAGLDCATQVHLCLPL